MIKKIIKTVRGFAPVELVIMVGFATLVAGALIFLGTTPQQLASNKPADVNVNIKIKGSEPAAVISSTATSNRKSTAAASEITSNNPVTKEKVKAAIAGLSTTDLDKASKAHNSSIEGYHVYPIGDPTAIYPHPLSGILLPPNTKCTLDVFLVQLAVLGLEIVPGNSEPTLIPDFNGTIILEDKTSPYHPYPNTTMPFNFGDDEEGSARSTVFVVASPYTVLQERYIAGKALKDQQGKVTQWLSKIKGGKDAFTSISQAGLTIENIHIYEAAGIPVAAISAGGNTTIRNNKITDVYPDYNPQFGFFNAFGIAFNGIAGNDLGYTIDGTLRIEDNYIDMNESGNIDYTYYGESPGVFGASITTVLTNAETYIQDNTAYSSPIDGIIVLDNFKESYIKNNNIDSQAAGFSPFVGFAPMGISAGSYFAPRQYGARVNISDNTIKTDTGMSAGILFDASLDIHAQKNQITMNNGYSAVVLYTGPTMASDPTGDVSNNLIAHNKYRGSAFHLFTVAHFLYSASYLNDPTLQPGSAYDNTLIINKTDDIYNDDEAVTMFNSISQCDIYLPSGQEDPIGGFFAYGEAKNNSIILGNLEEVTVCDNGTGNTIVGKGRSVTPSVNEAQKGFEMGKALGKKFDAFNSILNNQ